MGPKMLVAIVAVLGVAGCGTQTIIRTVTEGRQAATTTQPASPTQRAEVGGTLTLAGNGGESMAVTVDRVMDPLQVAPYDHAGSGQRYVGVQITLKNVGFVAYLDSPSNGATLLSNANQQATSETVSAGPCGNFFASSANIAPGNTQQGCIAFEMPMGQTPATFRFTLNSGVANQTGQWSLTGGTTNTGSASITTTRSATGGNAVSATGKASSACTGGPCVLSRMPHQCPPGLAATQSISCALARNVFYEYYQATQNHGDAAALSAWSPFSKRYYRATCYTGDDLIDCSISGTTDPNAEVLISNDVMEDYTPQQARAYAAKTDIGPNR